MSNYLSIHIVYDNGKRRVYLKGKRVSNGVWHNIQRRMMRKLKRGEQ